MKKFIVFCVSVIIFACSKGSDSDLETQNIVTPTTPPVVVPPPAPPEPDFDNDSIYSSTSYNDLYTYWTAFQKTASLFDVDLSYIEDVVIQSGTRNGTTMASAEGSCHDYIYIVVDETRFRNAETAERIFTMYHEFGHDIFNASHDGGGLMAPNVRELDYKLFQTEVSDFFNKVDFVEWTDEECEQIREITEPYPG
tara:strand:+ start:41 stop:628 length:588 start_codon:yes stop_codon:yes gene_type:complete